METGASLIDRLPNTVKVGPFLFDVVKWTGRDESVNRAYGQTSTQQQRISIAVEHLKTAQMAETLIHELMHCVFWCWNIDDEDKEERTITALALGFSTIWRDNPELMEWINQALTT